jgi:hypothetical protein
MPEASPCPDLRHRRLLKTRLEGGHMPHAAARRAREAPKALGLYFELRTAYLLRAPIASTY